MKKLHSNFKHILYWGSKTGTKPVEEPPVIEPIKALASFSSTKRHCSTDGKTLSFMLTDANNKISTYIKIFPPIL